MTVIINIPKTLRKFGYKMEKGNELRHSALLRAVNVTGRHETLFNMSSLVIMSKETHDPRHNIFKGDMDYLLKKIVKE